MHLNAHPGWALDDLHRLALSSLDGLFHPMYSVCSFIGCGEMLLCQLCTACVHAEYAAAYPIVVFTLLPTVGYNSIIKQSPHLPLFPEPM